MITLEKLDTSDAQLAWEPFVPSPGDEWDLKKVAHLHRRAGWGASWKILQQDLQDGPDAVLHRLLNPQEESTEVREVMAALRDGITEAPVGWDGRLPAYWLHCMLFHPDTLRERLTLFWHGHFATSNEKVQSELLMLRQNELMRNGALGKFGDLLTGIVADPAMLVWLDAANSPKKKPNENLARELLELFTLGIGHYSELDIRAAARALTGWIQEATSYGRSDFRFDENQFDGGYKTFLGETGLWGRTDIIRIALEHPACARFLCRKLYRQFIREDVEPASELLEPLADELRAHDYSIRHVVEKILRSRHFFAEANRRQRIASPVELSVGILRMLDVPPHDVQLLALAESCRLQGQQLFFPPNVAGWAGGRRWITSTNVIERTNWLSQVIWGNPALHVPPFDPIAWAERNEVPFREAGSVLVDLLLQGDLSSEARRLAMAAASPGLADGLRKAIQILVHCPEYQLV